MLLSFMISLFCPFSLHGQVLVVLLLPLLTWFELNFHVSSFFSQLYFSEILYY